MVKGRFKIIFALLLIVQSLLAYPLKEDIVDAVGIIYSVDLKKQELHQGTAFNVDPSGIVITSLHVVLPSYEDSRNPIIIIFDKYSYVGKILCADDLSDIAVIKVEGKDLPYIKLGSVRSLKEGSEVFALSFPGTEKLMFSEGRVDKIYLGGKVKFIITSAPLSFGSSGGPILNRKGEVIGIASFVLMKDRGTKSIIVASDNIRALLDFCYRSYTEK